MTFRSRIRSGIEKAYEGILSPEAIEGCVKWWLEVAVGLRNEAFDEAAREVAAMANGINGPFTGMPPQEFEPACSAVLHAASAIRKLKEGL